MATEVIIHHLDSYKSDKRVVKALVHVWNLFSEDLTIIYDEKDKKQFNELGQKIFELKMNTFSKRVQMNKDALANWWDIFTIFHSESYIPGFKRFKFKKTKLFTFSSQAYS